MPKISKPILYALVLGGAGYAVLLLTGDDTPPAKHTIRKTTTAVRAGNGITEADLSAHFPRYVWRGHDAFQPLVTPRKTVQAAKTDAAASKQVVSTTQGSWALTGITVVNGLRTAVVENSSTHDILFLKGGDKWNGMRVEEVLSDALLLRNPLDKQTRMTFEEPKPDAQQAPGAQPPVSPATPGAPAPPAGGAGGPRPSAQTTSAAPSDNTESVD